MNKIIQKKILKESFDYILIGDKTFEFRLADWSCNKDDTLILIEIDPLSKLPTGRKIKRRVGTVSKTKAVDFWPKDQVSKYGYQAISLLSYLPEIRIKDAWLLKENASIHLNELWGEGRELVSDEWITRRVADYQNVWNPLEEQILESMTEILGLSFKQNIIDVYIAPWFNAFSDPLVIGVYTKPNEFVDTLTHELIHRLLVDNTTLPYDTPLLEEWKKLFGKNHSFGTIIHIPVHAVSKAIYLDVLNEPKRLKRDIDNSKTYDSPDYLNAWNYVEKHGYMEIIKKLKDSYTRLNKKLAKSN